MGEDRQTGATANDNSKPTTEERPWLKSYDPWVEPDIRLPEKTYVQFLEEGLTRKPERAAVHYMGKTIPFRELDEYTRAFGGFLLDTGCRKGDVVGINMPNIPQYLIALLGAIRAGCVVTGISPLLTPKELVHQVNDAGVKVMVIMDALFPEKFFPVKGDVPGLSHVVTANVGEYLPPIKRFLGNLFGKIPKAQTSPVPGKTIMKFNEVMSRYPAGELQVETALEDVMLIQYTGGTTGVPKGTELTQKNLLANTSQARQWVEFEMGEDVLLSGFPFFHMAGLGLGLLAAATANPQCLVPDPRNTTHICKEIARYRPTALANVPTLYHMLMENPMFKTLDFSSVKVMVSGAAPFAKEGILALESIVGKNKVLEVYGMTETSPLMTMNPYQNKKKIGSVGVPISSTWVKIVDTENQTQEVPTGSEGEVICKGPQVMKGYHNKPEETQNTLRPFQGETWLYTGDIGKMDEDGFVYIVDRAKDMLNVGGYKVFSREVEETLYAHPDIEFCAIVGIPNEKRPGSEIVKCVIQLKKASLEKEREPLKSDILEYCKKNMAPYKVPKFIEFTDSIPLTAVGKVDKKLLR